jgi:polyhydroxybutyrate depolymerase
MQPRFAPLASICSALALYSSTALLACGDHSRSHDVDHEDDAAVRPSVLPPKPHDGGDDQGSSSSGAMRDGGGRDAMMDASVSHHDGGAKRDASDGPLPEEDDMDGGDDVATGMDAGKDASAPPRKDCDGKPGAPGDTTRMYQGRDYIVHIPANVYPDTAVPVVFAVHGAGGTGMDMQAGSQFDVLADQDGFVTVYPNGGTGSGPWNVGRNACPPGGLISTTSDDFAYFEHMLADVEQDQCINRQQVFVFGFSMGGYFSHHIGCQRGGDLVRAVAPHSGGTYAGDCPGAPVPIMMLHGDSDSLIPLSCDQTARDRWVERNGCAKDFDTVDITGGHCEWSRGCPANGQVVLCIFNGLDHQWAYPPMYDHSSLLIWSFFRSYL